MANKVGRPSKYLKKYCQMLIAHGKKGLSFEGFAGEIDVDKDTLYHWCKLFPEFSEAKKKAMACRNNIIEKFALSAAFGKSKCNPLILKLVIANSLGWHDKNDTAISSLPDLKLNYKID